MKNIFGKDNRRYYDHTIEQIISDIVQETGHDEYQVSGAIGHFFDWQWRSLNKAEYIQYRWYRFGKICWFNNQFQTNNNLSDDDLKKYYEWINNKTTKDKNHSDIYKNEILNNIDIDESKKPVINNICSEFSPEDYREYKKSIPKAKRSKLPKYAWYNKPSNTGGWNTLIMNRSTVDQLNQTYNSLIEWRKKHQLSQN